MYSVKMSKKLICVNSYFAALKESDRLTQLSLHVARNLSRVRHAVTVIRIQSASEAIASQS